MKTNSLIYAAGGTGLVGSALLSALKKAGYTNLISTYYHHKPKDTSINWHFCNLTDQQSVHKFFDQVKPEYVFLAAAKVGGIGANNRFRADFLHENLQIQNNIIQASYHTKVSKLLFLGSSCIYPRDCPQPIQEEHLLTDPLEYTNEPYAIAKIAGLKLCESFNLQYTTNYISVMPTNLYGPGDNFDLESSHVLPALIRKFHLAHLAEKGDLKAIERDQEIFGPMPEDLAHDLGLSSKQDPASISPVVRLWGTGSPRREFLYVEDLAEACLFLMQEIDFQDLVQLRNKDLDGTGVNSDEVRNTHINIGCGWDITIRELADLIQNIVGYNGQIIWDDSRPDGTPRKLLDTSRINQLDWKPKINLKKGIMQTYNWYIAQI